MSDMQTVFWSFSANMTPLDVVWVTFLFAVCGFWYMRFRLQKKTIGQVLVAAFVLRICLAIWLESGVKYDFVLDSLTFEYRGWLLAQKWITSDTFGMLSGQAAESTYYEYVLAAIFSVFGKDALIAATFNCFFSTISTFIIYRIQIDFFYDKDNQVRKIGGFCVLTAMLLSFYPSFLVWSATNIRDPLYFMFSAGFFYFLLRTVSKRFKATFLGKFFTIAACAVCFWGIVGLRSYVWSMFLAAIVAGYIAYGALKHLSVFKAVTGLFFSGVATAYAAQIIFPAEINKYIASIKLVRMSLANLGDVDNNAHSAFALGQTFNGISDILRFLPVSLSHYFFGPFPWEISGFLQGLSFFEALLVYFLVYPTLLGIYRAYKRAPFETVLLLSFILVTVLAQSLVISNMGTIFRHRTLPFLFLSIFAGEGLYEVCQKNFPAFFQAKHRGAGHPRRQPLGRSRTVRV